MASDLTRFVTAQSDGGTYGTALAELRAGRKKTHWMWFVFPQLTGLGTSHTAQHYAIADLGAVVVPGGPLDTEVRRRGQTVYLPDGSVPLHPPVLSEDAASLLPDGPRAAVLWTIDLDADGEPVHVDLRRARVRSRAQLDYRSVQAQADAGTLPEALALLPRIGGLLQDRAAERGWKTARQQQEAQAARNGTQRHGADCAAASGAGAVGRSRPGS